jgi:beta-N-acetylhexosaminidase
MGDEQALASISSVDSDACAVLLPLIVDLEVDTVTESLFRRGLRGLILGETAEEYDAGEMTSERVASETADDVRSITARLQSLAGDGVIVAVDQELAGIERLHRLVPALPGKEALYGMSSAEIEEAAAATGAAMADLGITLTLAPTLEVVRGQNPWLAARHLGPDPGEVARITSAFIRGMGRAGIGATAKHFPGCGPAATDPHYSEVRIRSPRSEYDELHLPPFRAALDAGAVAVMAGPAIVECIDPVNPVSVSAAHIDLLRNEMGFDGVAISVDLDSPATALGRSVPERAVDALNAGLDLLLVGLPPVAAETADAIVAAVAAGRLAESRLAEAATRVRALAAAS